MARISKRKPRRRRVGQVWYYFHHGAWHLYYLEAGRQVRRRAGDTEEIAAQAAAQVNAQLSAAAPTFFSFTPVLVAELRRRFTTDLRIMMERNHKPDGEKDLARKHAIKSSQMFSSENRRNTLMALLGDEAKQISAAWSAAMTIRALAIQPPAW